MTLMVCQRRKPSTPPRVAYRKRPPAFMVSWLPFRMCRAPPALLASRCSLSSQYRISTSSSPLSSWSPTCTNAAVLQCHGHALLLPLPRTADHFLHLASAHMGMSRGGAAGGGFAWARFTSIMGLAGGVHAGGK